MVKILLPQAGKFVVKYYWIRLLKKKPAGNHKATDSMAPDISTPTILSEIVHNLY